MISKEKVERLNERGNYTIKFLGGTEMLIDALPNSKHNMSMDVDNVRANKDQFNYLNDSEVIKKSQVNNYNCICTKLIYYIVKLMHPDHGFKGTRINSRVYDKASLHKS